MTYQKLPIIFFTGEDEYTNARSAVSENMRFRNSTFLIPFAIAEAYSGLIDNKTYLCL